MSYEKKKKKKEENTQTAWTARGWKGKGDTPTKPSPAFYINPGFYIDLTKPKYRPPQRLLGDGGFYKKIG